MLFEVEKAADRIRAEVDPDANIIFGNTILDDMEGRIRVSVVATGIDAEQMRQPERKVMPIRPHIKPSVFTVESPRPVAAANPVARQVEQLANELNAASDGAYMLGGNDAPEIPAPQAMHYHATETMRSAADMPLAPKPEAEKKAGWGFFGRRKVTHDLRQEPHPAPRSQVQAPPAAPQSDGAAPSGEDLFPEQSRDEQFEIPAFLRRQSN